MTPTLRQNLSFTLAKFSIVLACTVGFLIGIAQVALDLRNQEQEVNAMVWKILGVSHDAATRSVYMLDGNLAREVIHGLLEYGFITEARIYDDLGVLMAQETRQRAASPTQWLTHYISADRREYVMPLLRDGLARTSRGRLAVSVDMDADLANFYDRSWVVMRSMVAYSVILALLLFGLFYVLLTQPLRRLADSFSALAPDSGEGARLGVSRRHAENELGRLAQAGNDFIRANATRLAERKIAEERLRALLDSIPDLAWIKDREGRLNTVNHAYMALCGKSEDQILGKTAFDVWPADTAHRIRVAELGVLAHGRIYKGDCQVLDPDGHMRVLETIQVPIRDADGQVAGVAGIARDITERKESEEAIRYLAEHDVLTGLPNRLRMSQRMAEAIAATVGTQMHLAVLFLDLDHFKNINDSLGHAVGDKVLQQVADRLREALFEKDTLCRQGGDEFGILLVDCSDMTTIARIAERLLESMKRPFFVEEQEFLLSVSIGISVYPYDGVDIDTLLKNADAAMYTAKAACRGTYRFFEEEMNARVIERVTLESSLRKALPHGELELHYQPQFDLDSLTMVGVEALLRWRHPEQGMISPARFIPVAEESNLIVPIGRWVLREACRQGRAWLDAGLPPLNLAVNLSAVQFRQADLVDSVAAALTESGLPPGLLELEITESVVMQDSERMMAALDALQGLGVRLSVDDFGTGYSSLSYLRRFPIDKIKIDQSFIRDVLTNPDDAAITRTIIAIGAQLKLDVIAEGVETREQAEWLQANGCRAAQGYHFGRPVPPGQIPSLASQAGEKLAGQLDARFGRIRLDY